MLPRTKISLTAIPLGISKLTRRLTELRELQEPTQENLFNQVELIVSKVNATVEDVFGQGTAHAKDFRIEKTSFLPSLYKPTAPWQERINMFALGRDRAINFMSAAIERLNEKSADFESETAGRTLAGETGERLRLRNLLCR